jgi:hypothetical protein
MDLAVTGETIFKLHVTWPYLSTKWLLIVNLALKKAILNFLIYKGLSKKNKHFNQIPSF